MRYIIFSELNRYHLLFLTYFITIIIKQIVNDLYNSTDDIIESFNKYFSYTISDLLSIFPIIIIKIRSKRIIKNENILVREKALQKLKSKYSNNFNISDINKRRIRRIIKLETAISICDFLGKYSNVIFNIILAKSNYFIKSIKLNALYVVNIIVIYIMSIFILHTPFYRHNYLSLIINLIILIILVVMDQIKIFQEDNWNLQIFYTIMRLLIIVFYSFENIYAKILLSIDSISPYTILLYRGVIVGIITFIFSIIFIFVDIPDENGENSIVFTRFWKIYKNKECTLYTIGIALINFIFNLHIFFIIDKFSPSHYTIATILDSFGSLLIAIFKGDIEILDFFSKFILYLILIFAGLIYDEMIILNFCGLQKNTKLFLENQSKIEMLQTTINETNENNIEIENEIIKQEDMNYAICLKDIKDDDNHE